MAKYLNDQRWSECLLVAIWNAARFHGLETPEPASDEYFRICREAHAIHGGAIGVGFELDRLGLERVPGHLDLRWVREHLPVHFAIFCHRGYHSVLAVEVDGERLLLANYARGRTHWIEWDLLKRMTPDQGWPCQYRRTK